VFESLGVYLHQLGLGTYAPKAWKEVNYDRVVATIGAAVPVIQFLFERCKKERVDHDSDVDENRSDMLEAVQRRVEELMKKTVDKGGEIGLGFVEVPDALIRLEELSRVPHDAPTITPAGTPVLSVFDQFGHLLILGAPGTGKTTLLRKLARVPQNSYGLGQLGDCVSRRIQRIPAQGVHLHRRAFL
jgi:hypothetical protein